MRVCSSENGSMTDEEPRGVTSEDRVTVRRAPRYPRFIIIGAGLGAVVAFVLTVSFPIDPMVGFGATFGFFALLGVAGGAALSGLVAVVLDGVALRRARSLDAERTIVEPQQDKPGG